MKLKVYYLDRTPPKEREGSMTIDSKSTEEAKRVVETNPNRKVTKVEHAD